MAENWVIYQQSANGLDVILSGLFISLPSLGGEDEDILGVRRVEKESGMQPLALGPW